MSSFKQPIATGQDKSGEQQASHTLNMESLLEDRPANPCSRHENATDCDWACGQFSLVGSELVANEKAPAGDMNRESAHGDHPLQLGTPSALGVNKGASEESEGTGEASHQAATEISQKMKQAFLAGIESQPQSSNNQPQLGSNQPQSCAEQRTQSSPPPDLCQLEKNQAPAHKLEKTASGTTFSNFWRRPALQLFRKPEEGQVAPPLKGTSPYASPVSSRATSPTSLSRRAAKRTSSAPLNVAATKSGGAQQATLRNSPSPAQRALFRSPESSPDAFSYFEPARSHQPHYKDEQSSANAPYLQKTRSEPPKWKQKQPETVVENVEWNMDEEEDASESARKRSVSGGQSQKLGGHSQNSVGQSEKSGGRTESFGGQPQNFGGQSELKESEFSASPSWVDYRSVTEAQAEENKDTQELVPASPEDSDLKGSAMSSVQGESVGATSEGRKKRRRNRGKGRKKTRSETGNADSALSVMRSGGVNLAKSAGGDSEKGVPNFEAKQAESQKLSGGTAQQHGSEGSKKGPSLQQEKDVSDRASVNASASEPRERLSGGRWQQVIRKSSEEASSHHEEVQNEDPEDIELVEEEDNESDAGSDDLSDEEEQQLPTQELTRGTSIRDDFYHAPAAGQPSGGGSVNKAEPGEEKEESGVVREHSHFGWGPDRVVGFKRWHVVAMIGCSILTAFVGGRLYFEHLRRQEAKRKAERSCRISVPFGFGEVEVVEALRPLVCPKDHRSYV